MYAYLYYVSHKLGTQRIALVRYLSREVCVHIHCNKSKAHPDACVVCLTHSQPTSNAGTTYTWMHQIHILCQNISVKLVVFFKLCPEKRL